MLWGVGAETEKKSIHRNNIMNRKLIRPKLSEVKAKKSKGKGATTSRELGEFTGLDSNRRRQIPPEQTNAENFYYLKQMSAKTPVVVIMYDGEEVKGNLEWYDRDCIKVNRNNGPNLVIMKRYIKFLFKEKERR